MALDALGYSNVSPFRIMRSFDFLNSMKAARLTQVFTTLQMQYRKKYLTFSYALCRLCFLIIHFETP